MEIRIKPVIAAVTAFALFAGTSACSDGREELADAADSPSASVPQTSSRSAAPPSVAGVAVTTEVVPTTVATAAVIPDGRYERIITSLDAERLGVDPALADEAFGDGYVVVIEIEGDSYRQLGGSNPDRLEIGEEGSGEYDVDGNWVTRSKPIGCPGCTETIGWTLDGETLTLSAPDIEDPIGLVFLNGAYTRAGSDDVETLTMTGFLDFVPPQIVEFLDAVDAADEPVEITTDLTIGYVLSEAELIEAVAAGDVDMAFLGVRSFPRFDALLAPFLVDSYEVQEAVFAEGIPEAMLADLGVAGIVGIAAVPGPFRKIMGVDRTIDQAGDLAGTLVNTADSPLEKATFSALGATAVPGGPIDEVNAFATQLQAIPGNGYEDDAVSVTANLNMWPRPLGIIMNADALATLSSEQRVVLADAATAAVRAATAASRAEDTEALRWICPSPMEIIQMPAEVLGALEALVQPVYADLRQDPVVASEIGAIVAIKDSIATRPDTFTCE